METTNRQLILSSFVLICCLKMKIYVWLNCNCYDVLTRFKPHLPALDSLFLLCYFCKNFYVFSRLCPKSQLFARTAELMNRYVATSAEET